MIQGRTSDALLIGLAAAHVDPEHFNGLVSNLSKQPGSAALPSSSAMTAEQFKEVAALLAKNETEYRQEKAELEKLKAMDHEALKKALPRAITDIQLNNLITKLDVAEQQFTDVQAKYTPDHPHYKSVAASIKDLQQQIDDRVEGIMLGMQAHLYFKAAFVDEIKAKLQDLQNKNQRGP